jgi:hypothetical protein
MTNGTDRPSRPNYLSMLMLVGLLAVGGLLIVLGFFVYRWRHYISYGYSVHDWFDSHPDMISPGPIVPPELWGNGYEVWRWSTDTFYEFCASPVLQCSEDTVATVALLTAIGLILPGTAVVLSAVNSIRHHRYQRCSALPVLAKAC